MKFVVRCTSASPLSVIYFQVQKKYTQHPLRPSLGGNYPLEDKVGTHVTRS